MEKIIPTLFFGTSYAENRAGYGKKQKYQEKTQNIATFTSPALKDKFCIFGGKVSTIRWHSDYLHKKPGF